MSFNHRQQNMAVNSGHWPLFRFDPRKAEKGQNPLKLDSKPPSVPYRDFIQSETRFGMLWHSNPGRAETLLAQSEHEVAERYHRYQQLAAMDWSSAEPEDKE